MGGGILVLLDYKIGVHFKYRCFGTDRSMDLIDKFNIIILWGYVKGNKGKIAGDMEMGCS